MTEEQLVKLMQLDERQETLLQEVEQRLLELYKSCVFLWDYSDGYNLHIFNINRFDEIDMSDYPLDSEQKRNGWHVLPIHKARVIDFPHIDEMDRYDDFIGKVPPNNLF